MKALYLKNFRVGRATNSSSTHSVIYRNKGELLKDLDVFELNYYGRFDSTIAATKEAKIKYVLASIIWNSNLVRMMTLKYPEMKQYYPLIKKQMEDYENGNDDDTFGMYYRGRLYFEGDVVSSIDYLSHIIECDDIVIVGGSDEADFVMETCEGHEELETPDDVKGSVSRNGNYIVGQASRSVEKYKHSTDGRIRLMVEDGDPIPEWPELIDVKITNKCNHRCKFCYMDSNKNGGEADIYLLYSFVTEASKLGRIEFSIGGGNVLEYSRLEDLLSFIKDKNCIANITINAKDCDRIIKDEGLLKTLQETVSGVGISCFSPKDVECAYKLRKRWGNRGFRYHFKTDFVIHTIPEYLGVEKTVEIMDAAQGKFRVLFLGYKTNGRGASQKYHTFSNKDLTTITEHRYVSVDTTFANRYLDFLKANYDIDKTITLNEGEYSMYFDAVTGRIYKSSYSMDKPYKYRWQKTWGDKNAKTLKEAFTEIRRDGGFKIYEEECKKYYDV